MDQTEHQADSENQEHEKKPAPYKYALVAGALLLFVVGFTLLDMPGGTDWGTFYHVAHRIFDPELFLSRQSLNVRNYYNPPWYVVAFLPILMMPFRLGRAVGMALTIVAGLAILNRWNPKPGLIKPVLLLLSPPMIYNFLHGQLDLLVMAGIFLPAEWWVVVATSKPQTVIGLMFGIRPSKWLRAALITLGIVAASFLLFGNWVDILINKPYQQIGATANLWSGLWPFQVPAGVTLLLLGIQRQDERLLVASSPLLAPYASMGNLIGVWLAALTFLTDWQAAIIWLSWWGAVAYRLLI
jgi:hypothetical protein